MTQPAAEQKEEKKAEKKEDKKGKEIRMAWKVGAVVEVYSSSTTKWYKGEIVRVFKDDEGEWLEVKYDAGDDTRLKQMARDDEDTIRPLMPHPHININNENKDIQNTTTNVADKNKKRGRARTLPIPSVIINKTDTQTKSRNDQTLAPSPRSSNWKEIEFSEDHYAKPIIIDSHSMLIASGDMNENVYKYDFVKSKLKVYFKYPKKLEPFQVSTCMDHNKQKLYLYCNYTASKQNNFMEYDIATRHLHTYNKDLKDVGAFPVLCSLSGNIHLIGGRLNSSHLIWDDLDKCFSERPLFIRSKMIHGHAVIPLEGSKQILVMGGNNSHLWGGYLGGIWICDTVPSIQWKYMDTVAMPHKMYHFGYIKTKNERHILIFGGKTKTGLKDEIWILNLLTFEWIKSDIKCPKKGKFYAVKSRDGYIHLFEIDTKHYWKIKLTAIMGTTKHIRSSSVTDAPKIINSSQKTFTFASNAFDDEKQQNINNNNEINENTAKGKKDINIKSPTKPDWEHKVIELHNENMKLKKQVKQSKERIDALIQQNVKLNRDMRSMEIGHKKEIEILTEELIKYQNSNQ